MSFLYYSLLGILDLVVESRYLEIYESHTQTFLLQSASSLHVLVDLERLERSLARSRST